MDFRTSDLDVCKEQKNERMSIREREFYRESERRGDKEIYEGSIVEYYERTFEKIGSIPSNIVEIHNVQLTCQFEY